MSRLCSAPILTYPEVNDDASTFSLETDANNEGIEGVLYQIQRDEKAATACSMLHEKAPSYHWVFMPIAGLSIGSAVYFTNISPIVEVAIPCWCSAESIG